MRHRSAANIDVMMNAMASQITSLTIVYSTVYSGTNQRQYERFASLAFVRGIHRWPVNSPHKGPITRKMLPFDDVIMTNRKLGSLHLPLIYDHWRVARRLSPNIGSRKTAYRWLWASLQQLQCVSNAVTAVVRWAIDMQYGYHVQVALNDQWHSCKNVKGPTVYSGWMSSVSNVVYGLYIQFYKLYKRYIDIHTGTYVKPATWLYYNYIINKLFSEYRTVNTPFV